MACSTKRARPSCSSRRRDGGLLQRLRRLAPRLAHRDQVQAPVGGDVELAAEHALVEVVAAVAEARAQVVELDARAAPR